MNKSFFVALVCCLGLFTLGNSKLASNNYEEYKQSLGFLLKNGSLDKLQEIYYKVQNLIENGKQTADKIIPKDFVCTYLKKIGFTPAYESGLASQFNFLANTFKCSGDDFKSEYNTLLKASAKGDKLDDIHAAVKLAEANKAYNGTEVRDACVKVLDLIKEDGTTKSSKKSGESSLYNTARALEILEVCKSLGLLENKLIPRVKTTLESVLAQARTIEQGSNIFPEGDIFATTSDLIYSIYKLSPKALSSQDLARFARYLRNQEETAETPERNFLFYRAANILGNVPVVTLEERALTIGKGLTLKARIANLLGAEIKGKTFTLKASLYGKDAQDTTVALATDINFEKKSNGAYEAKLKESDIKKTGVYQIRLTVSDGTSDYDYVDSVVVKKALEVGSLRFGITKSQSGSDTPLEHKVNVGETYKGALSANQGNYIHIEFKVPAGSSKPSLAGARLVNKNHRFASGTIPAKLVREDNMYRIVIDLGDPDHILPYNGNYELELILSGELVETLKWTIAKIDLTFIKPATKAPASDADLTLLPEIHHQFPGERRKPAFIVTTFFDALVGVALVGFFVVLAKIGVNFDRFPKEFFGSILSILFLVLILGLFGTLTLFWLQINIFQTLLLLVILVVPTVVVGDLALKSIASKTA